ncbi:hypothetical protein PPROV_000675300 [Pycnococcus provasolii]|uniref:Ion transport domain-containing protein n=1 Tax=Pycnococcus provasolii TaxID=41880 RepID=A0A830HRE1_9CHLO|nr:hypothetical protein PPROV_000675300 [Pycnococcus provasolii]
MLNSSLNSEPDDEFRDLSTSDTEGEEREREREGGRSMSSSSSSSSRPRRGGGGWSSYLHIVPASFTLAAAVLVILASVSAPTPASYHSAGTSKSPAARNHANLQYGYYGAQTTGSEDTIKGAAPQARVNGDSVEQSVRRRDLVEEQYKANGPGATLPLCNFLNEEEYSVYTFSAFQNKDSTKGRFPVKQLKHMPQRFTEDTSSSSYWAPFSRARASVAFTSEHVVLRERVGTDRHPSVVALRLIDYATNFLSYKRWIARISGPSSFLDLDLPNIVDAYLNDYDEQRSIVRRDAKRAGQIAVNRGSHGDGKTNVAYVVEAATGNSLSKNRTFFDVAMYNLAEQQTEELDTECSNMVPAAQRITSDTSPTLCGEWIAFQRFDYTTNVASVILHSRASGVTETVARGGDGLSHIAPRLGPAKSNDGDAYHECTGNCRNPARDVTCRLAWVSTTAPLTLDDDGNLDFAGDDARGIAGAQINVINLPNRQIKEPIILPSNGTRLVDFDISGDQVYVLVESGGTDSGKALRRYDVHNAEWVDITQPGEVDIAGLQDASLQSLLYWVRLVDGQMMLMLYNIAYVPSRKTEYSVHCTVANTAAIHAASIYDDTVVWLTRTPSAATAIKLVDLNKDNDVLFDTADRFPLFGETMFDSDNDEIGDAAGLIAAHGSCTRSSKRGACLDDFSILYILWALYIVTVTSIAFFVAHIVSKKKKEAGKLPNYLSDEALASDAEDGPSDNDNDMTQEAKARRESNSFSKMHAEKGMQLQVTMQLVSFGAEAALLVLTIISLVVATIPFYSSEPLRIKTANTLMWTDFFITYVFLLDLMVRYTYRKREKIPNIRAFARRNWTDMLALFTDIPGLSDVGALSFLVFTRLRHVVRLFRLARILKVFRIIRLYRRFAKQNFLISFMIDRPSTFLVTMLCIFVIFVSFALKAIEQQSNPDFGSIPNVLWFCIVTITTVGYGDMAPRHVVSRILTISMMVLGVGILGLLTATMLKKILMAGKAKGEVDRRKQRSLYRVDFLKSVVSRMSAAYNPLVWVYGASYERHMGSDRQVLETVQTHHSSVIDGTSRLDEVAQLPVERMLAQNAGKFASSAGMGSSGGSDPQGTRLADRAAREKKVLMSMFESLTGRPEITPSTRLIFVLRYFNLDNPNTAKGGVRNFDRFVEDLERIIFNEQASDSTEYSLFIPKLLTIQTSLKEESNQMSNGASEGEEDQQMSGNSMPCFTDPLDFKMVGVEEMLRRYNVIARPDYDEILLELMQIILLYDRVENAKWVMENCSPVKKLPPMKRRKPPIMTSKLLQHQLDFVIRRKATASSKDGFRHARRRPSIVMNSKSLPTYLPSSMNEDDDNEGRLSRRGSDEGRGSGEYSGGGDSAPGSPSRARNFDVEPSASESELDESNHGQIDMHAHQRKKKGTEEADNKI